MFWACAPWSPSSSEEANASESGVERRMPGFDFSRMAEAVPAEADGVGDCAIEVGLVDGEAILSYRRGALLQCQL
jgi:hypothetical protein